MIVQLRVFVAAATLFVFPVKVMAAPPSCDVEVRLLGHSAAGEAILDSDLDKHPDLGEQLKAVPISDLHLLQSEAKRLSLLDAGTFQLKDAQGAVHRIEVTPREKIGSRLHIGVNWTGPQGEAIVSTLLHVEDGRHVVIGKDQKVSPMVVCIRVRCDEARGG